MLYNTEKGPKINGNCCGGIFNSISRIFSLNDFIVKKCDALSFIVNSLVFFFLNYKTFNYKLNYILYSLYMMQALWLFCCCDDHAYSSWKSESQFKFKEQTIHINVCLGMQTLVNTCKHNQREDCLFDGCLDVYHWCSLIGG